MLATLLLFVNASCGGKGGSLSGDDDDGTINPPEPTGKMTVQSGQFSSGSQASSDSYTVQGFVTSYETTMMESHQYQALDVTVQAIDKDGGE